MPSKCVDSRARGPNLKVSGYGCASPQIRAKKVCSIQPTKQETKEKRQEPKEIARKILDEQYAQSLEQQIKLLEFENRFLRDRGQSYENRCARYRGQEILLRDGNEVSLDGGHSWCRLPSHHPPLEHLLQGPQATTIEYADRAEDINHNRRSSKTRRTSESPEEKTRQSPKLEDVNEHEPARNTELRRRPSTILESDEENDGQKSPKTDNRINSSPQKASTSTSTNPRPLRPGPVKQASVSRIDEIKKSIDKRKASLTAQVNSIGRRSSMPAMQRSASLPRRADNERKTSPQRPTRQGSVQKQPPTNGNLRQQLEEQEDLIQELERESDFLNSEIQDRDRTIAQIREKLRLCEEKQTSKIANDSRDKRALMEEFLELQRRLDELTPILAEKEAHIARLENERDLANTSIRNRDGEIRKLQVQLSEKQQERTYMSDRETNHREETKRFESAIARIEEREKELRDEIRGLTEDLVNCRQHGSELEMRLEREKNLAEQLAEENSRLIGKNAELSADMEKLEMAVTKALAEAEEITKNIVRREDFDRVKSSEANLRVELEASIERHKNQLHLVQQLEKQIKEQEDSSTEFRENRERIQREFDALQALSRSLTEENKALRGEILDLKDKLEQQRLKIHKRDSKISELEDELGRAVKVHQETVHKVERETRTQRERGIELEDVTRRLREIADSLPRTAEGSLGTRSQPRSANYSREESMTSQQSPYQSVRRGTRVVPLLLDECHSPQSPHDIQKIIDMARNTLKRS